jgi:hypothetical protein
LYPTLSLLAGAELVDADFEEKYPVLDRREISDRKNCFSTDAELI